MLLEYNIFIMKGEKFMEEITQAIVATLENDVEETDKKTKK